MFYQVSQLLFPRSLQVSFLQKKKRKKNLQFHLPDYGFRKLSSRLKNFKNIFLTLYLNGNSYVFHRDC